MQAIIFTFTLIILVVSNCGSTITEAPTEASTHPTIEAPAHPSHNEWEQAWSNLKAAFGSIGKWFSRQIHSVEDMFAKSKEDLKMKVDETEELLEAVKRNQQDMLNSAKKRADNATIAAINNVDAYLQEVNEFQKQIRNETSESYDRLKNEWEQKSRTMYNGGLNKIISFAQQLKADK